MLLNIMTTYYNSEILKVDLKISPYKVKNEIIPTIKASENLFFIKNSPYVSKWQILSELK